MGIQGNLPPIIAGGSGSSPMGSNPLAPSTGPVRRHAQDLSTSQLNQHRDRQRATVSMNQSMSGRGTKTSSVFRVADHIQRAKSSIAHVGEPDIESRYGSQSSEEADDLRYAYSQGLIRARKNKEAKAALKEAKKMVKQDATHLKVGGGGSFTKSGAAGFHKKLRHHFKKYRGTYKNISKADSKIFEDAISKYAARKRTGSKWGFTEKRNLKRDMYKQFKSGSITREDLKDFRKLINNL